MNESTPSNCSTRNTQIPIRAVLRQTRESLTEIFTKYRQKVGNGALLAVQRVKTSQQLSLIKPSLRCVTKRQRYVIEKNYNRNSIVYTYVNPQQSNSASVNK